jgi:hypothetical protein
VAPRHMRSGGGRAVPFEHPALQGRSGTSAWRHMHLAAPLCGCNVGSGRGGDGVESEGDAVGAGGGAVAVIQRECVVARRRRGW